MIVFLLLLSRATGQLYQSHITLSNPGFEYYPAAWVEDIEEIVIGSFHECALVCNQYDWCRTFDHNQETLLCRLFQGESSTGQIISSLFPTSQVGSIAYVPRLFTAYGKTCDFCTYDRYMECIDDLCDCPGDTYWDGEICRNQKYKYAPCIYNWQCRWSDYQLTCVDAPPCTAQGYESNRICGVGNSTILLQLNNNTDFGYTRYSYTNITALTNMIVITFAFQQDAYYWFLDDVDFRNASNASLIIDGGFEEGNNGGWEYWSYCNPFGVPYWGERFVNSTANTGIWSYRSGAVGNVDYLSQTIQTIAGQNYTLSFWLACGFTNISRAEVTVSYF